MTGKIIDIGNENQSVLRKGVVIVDFYATWCGPCKRLAPAFSNLAEAFPSVVFAKVDGDENENLMTEFNVEAFPTVLLLVNGEVVNREEGCDAQTLAELVNKAQTLLQ